MPLPASRNKCCCSPAATTTGLFIRATRGLTQSQAFLKKRSERRISRPAVLSSFVGCYQSADISSDRERRSQAGGFNAVEVHHALHTVCGPVLDHEIDCLLALTGEARPHAGVTGLECPILQSR